MRLRDRTRPPLRQRARDRNDLLVYSRRGIRPGRPPDYCGCTSGEGPSSAGSCDGGSSGPDASRAQRVLKARHPTLCVPQDFDLSPYFDVVKFNAREPIEFDWVRED